MPALRPALLLLLGIGSLAAPVHAQQPAALELTVTDASSGAPIRGALVRIAGGAAFASAPSGVVVIRGLAAGQVAGEVTHLGYEPRSFAIPLSPGATLSLFVPLEPQPVPIAAVEVEVESSPYGVRSLALKEFYERVEGGAGHYITREQIDRWNPRQVSDLFRMVPGLETVHTPNGERATWTARETTVGFSGRIKECPIQYFVDGTPYEAASASAVYLDVRPQEIEGIEFYRGTLGVPSKFRRANRNCGVILIWKRERM